MKNKQLGKVLGILLSATLAIGMMAGCGGNGGQNQTQDGGGQKQESQQGEEVGNEDGEKEDDKKENVDYSSYTYEELAGEDWEAKTIVRQFLTFDANNVELQNFNCVMNLYEDGTLSMYQFSPWDTLYYDYYDDADHNLRYIYYGFWTEEDGKITTNYICNDNTALNRDSLIDDQGGWVTSEYGDSETAGVYRRSGGAVAALLSKDTAVTNTEAVEHTHFVDDGTVYYQNVQEIYDAMQPHFKPLPQQ